MMEILINILIVIAKFIPVILFIVAGWVIHKRYPVTENEFGLTNDHVRNAMKALTAVALLIILFTAFTSPSVVPKNTIYIQQKPVYNEPSRAKVQDLTVQPKMTDEERAQRFENITKYKDE
jgi:hypothetical protein